MWNSPLRTSSVVPRIFQRLPFCRLLLLTPPFFHHGFPLIHRLRGRRRYSLCFHGVSSSVRQFKSSQSNLLSHAFHDLSNVSRLFRPHHPYTLSLAFPRGNGQSFSRFGTTLGPGYNHSDRMSDTRFPSTVFFPWGENFNLGISHTSLSFHRLPSIISFLGETATSISRIFSVGPPSLLQHSSSLSPSSF